MSLSRESLFRHKVVYSVHDDCSLRQKSIHHERENTMLYSRVLAWYMADYSSLFNSGTANLLFKLIIELSSKSLWVKINVFLHWENVEESTCFRYSSSWSNAWLLSYERTKTFTGVVVCKFYWEMDRDEKYWIKNARGRSNLCLSRIFILLES